MALLVSLFAAGLAVGAAETTAPHPLAWDAMEKSLEPEPGTTVAAFTFSVTNRSAAAVSITEISPSCGCTVVQLPAKPWVLAPGVAGTFEATVDFRGKHGEFSKTIGVHSTAGLQTLRVTVKIPDTPEAARERNRQLATLDRQAVFRGDCRSCHVTPAQDRMGAELFQTACAICHIASPRASMVPDLLVAREPRDAAYWRKWIGEGKAGTLMPAFARKHEGPLSDAQIESLIEFALLRLPTEPKP